MPRPPQSRIPPNEKTDVGKWVYVISGADAPGWEEGVVYRGQIQHNEKGGKNSFLSG